jgi:hypothetical protein
MKTNLFIISLLFLLSCQKDIENEYTGIKTSSGNAFILKSAFFDNYSKTTVYNPTDSTYQYTNFNFDLNLEFYDLENMEFSHFEGFPNLFSYSNEYNGFGFPVYEKDDTLTETHFLSFETNFPNINAYDHLILMSVNEDKDRMYHGHTGFFLEQYIEAARSSNANNKIMLGYYNQTSQSLEIMTNELMPDFYDRTANANKKDQQSFTILNPQNLLDEISSGINNLLYGTQKSKQLTLITYSAFDTTGMNYDTLDYYANLLKTNNIVLNVLSLLPNDFLQPLVFKSGGFYQTDISSLYYNFDDFINQQYEFELLLENAAFASSFAIQNLHQLITNNNKFTRFTIESVYAVQDSTTSYDSLKSVLKLPYFKITLENTKDYYPQYYTLKPIVQ